jgi:hypothetical protein
MLGDAHPCSFDRLVRIPAGLLRTVEPATDIAESGRKLTPLTTDASPTVRGEVTQMKAGCPQGPGDNRPIAVEDPHRGVHSMGRALWRAPEDAGEMLV